MAAAYLVSAKSQLIQVLFRLHVSSRHLCLTTLPVKEEGRTRSALSKTHQDNVQEIVVEKGDEHGNSRQEWRQDSGRSSASSTLSDIRPDGHRFNMQSRERSQLLLHVQHQSIKSQHHVQYLIDPDRGIHNNQS